MSVETTRSLPIELSARGVVLLRLGNRVIRIGFAMTCDVLALCSAAVSVIELVLLRLSGALNGTAAVSCASPASNCEFVER